MPSAKAQVGMQSDQFRIPSLNVRRHASCSRDWERDRASRSRSKSPCRANQFRASSTHVPRSPGSTTSSSSSSSFAPPCATTPIPAAGGAAGASFGGDCSRRSRSGSSCTRPSRSDIIIWSLVRRRCVAVRGAESLNKFVFSGRRCGSSGGSAFAWSSTATCTGSTG